MGLGFRAKGGFRVQGLGLRIWGWHLQALGIYDIWDSMGLGFRVQGLGCLGFKVFRSPLEATLGGLFLRETPTCMIPELVSRTALDMQQNSRKKQHLLETLA